MTVALIIGVALTVALSEPVANDPNAWLVWAGQLARGSIPAFQTGPSWKPLPALITLPAALVSQSTAAFTWMVLVRFCALAASVLLFAITKPRWGTFAAVVAAFMPLVIPDWATATITGLSEPVMLAAALAALEAHLRGRTRIALLMAVIACLVRPEAWIFIAAYSVWLLRTGGAREAVPILVAGGAIVIGWFLPIFGAHGDALQAASRAHDYRTENGGSFDLGVWLRSVPAKLWPLIPVGLIAAVRKADVVTLVATAAAGVWLIEVAILVLAGYPNFSRFVLPAFVVLCLAGGAGAGWLTSLASARWQAVLVQCLISLAALWGLAGAFDAARASWRQAERIVTNADRAERTLQEAGGVVWISRCSPIATNGYPKYDRILSRRLGLALEIFTNHSASTTLHGSGVLTGPPTNLIPGGQVVSAYGGWTLTVRPSAGCSPGRR